MINFNIYNVISRLNNGDSDFKISQPNTTIVTILDKLELKGFINYSYDPYTKNIIISNNKIKHIIVKSKPSRRIYVETTPYKLTFGVFISKPSNKNKLVELLLYVD